MSAVSPCNFWCQPAKSSTTDLPLLMDKIQDCYSGSEVVSEEVDDMSIGMPCVSQFSNDEIWHRAMITSIDGDSVTVRFVDYGNTRDVSRSKVRAIVSHFTELPMQAFKCVLSGVSPVGGAWDAASCNRFQEMVVFEESKEFRVEVITVTQGDVLEVSVTLWDGQSSIGQQLVDSGYGVESTQLDDTSEATSDWSLQKLIDVSRCLVFIWTPFYPSFWTGRNLGRQVNGWENVQEDEKTSFIRMCYKLCFENGSHTLVSAVISVYYSTHLASK